MLTLTQHTTNSLPHPFLTLEAMLAEPFPRTPQDMTQLEQRLSIAAAQTADQIGVLGVITRKFSVREIATKSLLVARNDYIWKNNAFCST